MPKTRFLSSEVTLASAVEGRSRGAKVVLVPTASGDPLLSAIAQPAAPHEVVLAGAVASELEVREGDSVTAVIRYEAAEGLPQHMERRSLRVVGILPIHLEQDSVAYALLPLLRNVERVIEGRPVPDWGWAGRIPAETAEGYASFRIFAADMESVEPLVERLRALGTEPRSRLAEIRFYEALNSNLTRLVLIISLLAVVGVLLSTAIGQYAAVVRKRRDYCLLLLIGYTVRQVAILPVFSGMLTSLLGILAASLFYLAIDPAIEHAFAGRLLPGVPATRLEIQDVALCLVATVAVSLAATGYAAWQVTRIAPADGLRDE